MTVVKNLELDKVIEICRVYGIRKVALFGSYARGESRPDSDVDLIVDFERPIGFIAFVRLERELSELLGRKVDLLTESSISPHLRDKILDERQVIYDAAG